jgi:hypothetical protein
MSPRRNWNSPTPSLVIECAPPSGTKGGGGEHTRLRVKGWGSPNADDWRKSLALCLLCGATIPTTPPFFSRRVVKQLVMTT